MLVVRGGRLLVLVLAAAVLPGCAQPRGSVAGLRPVVRIRYSGGTRLAFDGRYVYAGQFNGTTQHDQHPGDGGVRIVDSAASPPRLVATIHCPGYDNDVALVRHGLLALGYHQSTCGPGADGVTFYDVHDPTQP